MKPDTERKKHYKSKMHQRRKKLRAHLSKELRGKLKQKKRSLLLRKGDKVQVARGPGKGKTGKIAKLNTAKRRAFVEGMTVKNARAKEVLMPLQPSNLVLLELAPTPERKKLFTEEAFVKEKKKQPKKEEKPPARDKAKELKGETPPAELPETRPEPRAETTAPDSVARDKNLEKGRKK